MKRWIRVDVVETSPGRFVVGVGRWFRILEREGMVIVSKFRCDMIQVPSGRSEHWLLIKIILMKKIERKTGAASFNPTDLFVRRHIDSKDPSCATRFKFNQLLQSMLRDEFIFYINLSL